MKMLYVEWEDSISYGGGRTWNSKADIETNESYRMCQTVGFVVKETKVCLTLAGGKGAQDSSFAGDITIPKCAIIKRRVVRMKK